MNGQKATHQEIPVVHTYPMSSTATPDGRYILSGSYDKTIRIWDAETGGAVGQPLEGHTGTVYSVAYSPDGQRIISGSDDETIQIWDANTGVAVGDPLKGHTRTVRSVACSPDGRHIISGSDDMSIQIWHGMAGGAPGKALERHTGNLKPTPYSPDGQLMVSASVDKTTYASNSFSHPPIQHPSSCTPMYPHFYAQPDSNGWARDSEGGLLYWVPPDCRAGLHSHALLTIPLTSNIRSVSLDFADFAFGTSWVQTFQSPQP